jgi:hypothetical protein
MITRLMFVAAIDGLLSALNYSLGRV